MLRSLIFFILRLETKSDRGDCSSYAFLNRLTCGFRRVPQRKPSVSPKEPIGFLGGTQRFLRRHPTVSSAAPKRFRRCTGSLITPGESQTSPSNSQKTRYPNNFTHHFCCFFVIFCCYFAVFDTFSALFRRFFAVFCCYFVVFFRFFPSIYHSIIPSIILHNTANQQVTTEMIE